MSKTIKLELSEEEVNTMLFGLLELPAKMSMELINKVRGQALQQISERNRPTESAKDCESNG